MISVGNAPLSPGRLVVQQLHCPMPEEVPPQHDSAVTKTFGKLATCYGQRQKSLDPSNVEAEIFWPSIRERSE
jgi:hypothetical protein